MKKGGFLMGLAGGVAGTLLAPWLRARADLRRRAAGRLLGGRAASTQFTGTPCAGEDRTRADHAEGGRQGEC